MAFDGIVVKNIVHDLNQCLINGRLSKIAQPESDELQWTIKTPAEQYRLLLSASASLPLLYLTDMNKPSPMTAPNFCMLLRKHIANGRIVSITQPGLERIVDFEIEHYNDLGDLCTKHIMVELMGKHSNIIFCDDQMKILDSIKHISAQVSSVREVLPGRDYFIPDTRHKKDPLTVEKEEFLRLLSEKNTACSTALYQVFTGISPLVSEELFFRASLDSSLPFGEFSSTEQLHFYRIFSEFIEDLTSGNFSPCIVWQDGAPTAFSSIRLSMYSDLKLQEFEHISPLLSQYYKEKEVVTRIRQKSVNLRKIVSNALERSRKKYQLQMRQLDDTKKRDKFKLYGELISVYGYGCKEGDTILEAENYYTNEMVKIPIDPTLSVAENSQKYFQKYNKLKRTYEALSELTKETEEEILHLESIENSLQIAVSETDLAQIREELVHAGYIKKRSTGGKQHRLPKSKPFHYRSHDGFDIYIGKNNFQNDELTWKFARGNDWWFHAKKMPGSHVIVRTDGKELPDRTFEEAARLAAYYSSGRNGEKVEIDYLERKNVKRPNSAKPGFVIYYTNYSMTISPDISGIPLIED